MMEDTAASRRKRNKKGSACTQCRQLKFKCDAAELFPNPCSRCTKAGHRCAVDPSFKRVAQKERLDSLEKELQQMRQEIRSRGIPSNTSYQHENGIPTGNTSSAAGNSDVDSQAIQSETINGVELSPTVILALIQEYYTNYHPQFPILSEQEVFLSHYNDNRLLLWTILAIASRELAEHTHFFQLLVDPVRQLASDLHSSISRSFETVQALLLLCAWPFPFGRTINDPSPMYVALATQIAYQSGAHRPQFAADFAESRYPQGDPGELARKKLWFGCVILNHCSATKLGVPSTVRPGYAVLSEMVKGSASVVPEPLLSMTCLSHIGNKAITALGDSEYSASGALPDCLPLVRAFESELMEAYEGIKQRWTPEIEIFYHTQLLQVYSFALCGQVGTNQESVMDASILQIYAKAVTSVLSLISVTNKNPQNSKYWPGFITYSILYAVIFNAPLANMEKHGSSQRLELIQSFRDGIVLMKSFSKFERDIWSRISSHANYILYKIEQSDRDENSPAVTIAGLSTAKNRIIERGKPWKPPVTSRIAANILYHVIWTGKHGSLTEEKTQSHEGVLNNEETHRTDESDIPHASNGFPSLEDFNPFLNDFAFPTDWTNSGILDISADWQSLIENI